MPKVIYRGPTQVLEVDDKVLLKDGEAVELTPEQLKRAEVATPDIQLEVVGSTPPSAPSTPPAGGGN